MILLCDLNITVSQTKPPKDPMKLSFDFARFRYDEKEMYIEFYYAFPQRLLTYVPDGGGMKAGVELTLSVASKDSIVYAERMLVPHVSKDTSFSSMNLISMSNTKLTAGQYTLKVVARDQNNKSRGDSVSVPLNVKSLPTDRITMSDIEFASSIKKGKPGNLFYKNTIEVIPNPEGVYTNDQHCYYYAEAYNLLLGSDQSDLTLKTSVYNTIGKEVISREQPRKRAGESMVLVGNVDAGSLRSGTYTLFLALIDSSKKPVIASGKKFFVFNTVLGFDSTLMGLDRSIGLGAFISMEEPQLDEEFKWMQWESREAEKDQYKSLKGVTAKRKFMTDFWSKRPVGLRDEYLRRVATANTSYGVMGVAGYRTDRGRAHIMYGPADDIERHPNESQTRPYEIWSYNSIQGGVIFVFLLRQNGGDYELVHSTHRNELHDENWARYAQTN